MQHLQTLSNLYKSAADKAPGAPVLTPQNFEIISMHVIDPSEARSGVQLMAMTANGVRLYFAPSSGGYYSHGFTSGGGAQTSSRLQLIHVRLPPPNLLHPDEQARPYRAATSAFGMSQPPPPSASRPFIVSGLEHSCYDSGLTVAAQAGEVDGTDFILCMSPDLTRVGTLGQVNSPPPPQPQNAQYANGAYGTLPNAGRPPITEYAAMLSIPGRTWAMAPVPRGALAKAVAGPPGVPSPVVTNELAYQFSEPTREFMILTNVGLTFLSKRRSLDYLKAVLEEYQLDQNSTPLTEFVMRSASIRWVVAEMGWLTGSVASGGIRRVRCCSRSRAETRSWILLSSPHWVPSALSALSWLALPNWPSTRLATGRSGLNVLHMAQHVSRRSHHTYPC